MGQVVPFIARVRDSGDWTAAERDRLSDLADRFAAAGVKVEVVFGATEEGDPWCVVTDADGEVLIHVARIGGAFVVHSALDDSVSEAGDLHAALRDRLAATEEAIAPPSAKILPFDLSLRQAQTLLALVVATAFFYETAGGTAPAEAAELPHAPAAPDEPPPPTDHDDAPLQDRELATRGAALHEADASGPATATALPVDAPAPVAAPAAEAEPLPAAAPLEPAPAPAAPAAVQLASAAPADEAPVVVVHGTDHDDVIQGTAANEHILGGAGNDTLSGGGGHDTLDGGAGDDRIELGEGVVAIGGKGADTFVVHGPIHGGGHPDTLLGVIVDFSSAEGDRIMTWRGDQVRLPPPPTGPDGQPLVDPHAGASVMTAAHTFGPTTVAPQTTVTRVDVDLDGDGVNDGYILVAHRDLGPPPADGHDPKAADPPPAALLEEPPITVVGAGFHYDPIG